MNLVPCIVVRYPQMFLCGKMVIRCSVVGLSGSLDTPSNG